MPAQESPRVRDSTAPRRGKPTAIVISQRREHPPTVSDPATRQRVTGDETQRGSPARRAPPAV
jgi:hypothetical protein